MLGFSTSTRHPFIRHGLRTSLLGVAANAALAAVKMAAGVFGHSYALIADGIESLSDVASSLIVLMGLRLAVAPPDDSHPYGHGKAEPLTALVVVFALYGAAITIAVQSIGEILNPHLVPAPFTLAVLAGVILVKEGLFRTVFRVGEEIMSTAVKTDAWHHRSDAITSGAAFVGISIALVGGPAYAGADDWAALLAAGIIVANATRLLLPALGEVMDSAPRDITPDAVRGVAASVCGVTGPEKCLVRKVGFDYYVDLHILVDGDLSVRRGHEVAHVVKDAVRTAFPHVTDVLVHVEPDDLPRCEP